MNSIKDGSRAQADKGTAHRFGKGRSPERAWRAGVMYLFRAYKLRIATAARPGFEKINEHWVTGSIEFVDVDHRRCLLIGTMGWFRGKGFRNYWRYVQKETKWEALRKLQEEVGQYARDEGFPYQIILEPEFAADPSFSYLWVDAENASKRKEQQGRGEAQPPAVAPPQGDYEPRIVRISHDMTKTRYPMYRPGPNVSSIERHLGGGRWFSLEANARKVRARDGELTTIKRLPWGTMCTQIEIFLYNVHQQTRSDFVCFDWPTEITTQLGYRPHQTNYTAFKDRVMDMMFSSAHIYDEEVDDAELVSPILYASLWDKEDVKLDTLGRPNRGRTRLIDMDQQTLIPSIIRLNPQWLHSVALQYSRVDLNILNKAIGAEVRYQLLLKVWELGTRGQRGMVPFWGENGLVIDLEMAGRGERLDKERRKSCRRSIKAAMAWIAKQTGCPFEVTSDAIIYSPWTPLNGRRASLDVPEATTRILSQGRDVEELMKLRKTTLARLKEDRALSKAATIERFRRLSDDGQQGRGEARA